MKQTLSPKEVAAAVGVSESTLKRWADNGQLRMSRTAGGHRRIPLAEAMRFARDSKLAIVRPDILGMPGLPPLSGEVDIESAEDRLFELLKAGKGLEARALVMDLFTGGTSIAELCDGPIRGALERIGQLWSHDTRGIFLEHRATDICVELLMLLRAVLPRPEPEPDPDAPPRNSDGQAHDDTAPARPIAVGGAPAGDPYLIPSLMVACCLAEAGFQEVNLGPDTPTDSLLLAVEHYQPRLVWMACAVRDTVPHPAALQDLAQAIDQQDSWLVLGGRGLPATCDLQTDRVSLCSNMAELVECGRARLSGDSCNR